jgi:D-glycero-D-manno-heptose 1,7-bisphosphate phosphatase
LREVFAARGARIDAMYHCPHHPDFTGPCECRKPGTLLFRRAAADFGIDFRRSAYIGDRLRDVQQAQTLGGVGIMVPVPSTPADELERAKREFVVADTLMEAVRAVLAG